MGSLVKLQLTEPASPAKALLLSAPKVATEVELAVEAVCEPLQAVPTEPTEQV